jgi:hypothetical protein
MMTTTEKTRRGILSTTNIGKATVTPGIQKPEAWATV